MKEKKMRRRSFLQYSAAAAFATGLLARPAETQASQEGPKLRKSLQLGMLPKRLSNADKFKLAKKCGFDGIEASPMEDLTVAEEMGKMARDAGVPIHSIVYGGWGAPLSDPTDEVQQKGLAGMRMALTSAKAFGCDAVLLVPAIVTETVGYGEAYERSQKNIRKLLPFAEKLGVVIAVENVWNKFLLSPLEFAAYVDEFQSPWVKAYFDVGNIAFYGYPQDWIRTLGKRIVKLHLKDFRLREVKHWQVYSAEFVGLREGAIDWKEVHKALDEIGYSGAATVELDPGDLAYLREVSRRVDLILSGV